MKRLWLCGLIGSVLMFGQSAAHSEAASRADMVQARSVVEAYLGALVQGDLASIRQLLGGTFLRKKEQLLNDPEYSARLVELYSGASYEITRIGGEADGRITVDVRLDMGSSGALGTRFIVDRVSDPSTDTSQYLIMDEVN